MQSHPSRSGISSWPVCKHRILIQPSICFNLHLGCRSEGLAELESHMDNTVTDAWSRWYKLWKAPKVLGFFEWICGWPSQVHPHHYRKICLVIKSMMLLLAPCMDWESKVARFFQYFPITSQFLPCHTPLPFLDTLTKLHYRIWNCDSIRVHKTNAGDTNRVGLSVPATKRAAGASESRRASGGSWALKSGATGNMAVATPTQIKRNKKKSGLTRGYKPIQWECVI